MQQRIYFLKKILFIREREREREKAEGAAEGEGKTGSPPRREPRNQGTREPEMQSSIPRPQLGS